MYSSFVKQKFDKNTIHTEAKCFGILNLTPDSFSDGSGDFASWDYQQVCLENLAKLSVDYIDLGAQSTRPGAKQITDQEELERLLPFLARYAGNFALSLDSYKPLVIKEALAASKQIKFINDVTGLQNPKLLEQVADTELKLIAMHYKDSMPPVAAKDLPDDFYDRGLERDLMEFFTKTLKFCEDFGIAQERVILDPGFGFAKNLNHSLELVNLIPKLKPEFGLPVFVGSSRKSFLKLWQPGKELDEATLEFNEKLTDIDFFRMHGT